MNIENKENNVVDVENTETTQEQKTYSQEKYDSDMASQRRRYEKKIADLENQLALVKKQPIVEKALLDNGCKKEALQDILKLNPELMNCEEGTLNDAIKNIANRRAYCFEKQEFNPNPFGKVEANKEKDTKENLEKLSVLFGK